MCKIKGHGCFSQKSIHTDVLQTGEERRLHTGDAMSALEGSSITHILSSFCGSWLFLSWRLRVVPLSYKSAYLYSVECSGSGTKCHKAECVCRLRQQVSSIKLAAF